MFAVHEQDGIDGLGLRGRGCSQQAAGRIPSAG